MNPIYVEEIKTDDYLSQISMSLLALFLFTLSGCASMIPGLTKCIDDAITDDAININITKEALQRDTDVKVIIDVSNNNHRSRD